MVANFTTAAPALSEPSNSDLARFSEEAEPATFGFFALHDAACGALPAFLSFVVLERSSRLLLRCL